MQVAGIIAEYNPFHNGHQYQLTQVRKETGADYIIIAMSGDFVQRGEPAIVDKYARTRMALDAGADLVLELPAVWSSSSAEYFASAGIQLLGKTGIVSTLCYGSEAIRPSLMQKLVSLSLDSPDSLTVLQNDYLKQGDSYPAARCKALRQFLPDADASELQAFLHCPNNILSLEYEKAMVRWNVKGTHPLQGHAILRIGSGYHSTGLSDSYISATAIRQHLLSHAQSESPKTFISGRCKNLEVLREKVPTGTFHILSDAAEKNLLLDCDAFSLALYTRLWELREQGYDTFADCGQELSCKIRRNLSHFIRFSQFARLLKSRNLTQTRIYRALLHILLDIRQEQYATLWEDCAIPYLRVLGFRKDAAPLLTAIKKEASVPLITKVSDASRTLPGNAQKMLSQEIRCADLYRTCASIQCNCELPNEYTQGVILL